MTSDAAILRRLAGFARPWRGRVALATFAACVTVMASFGLMAVAGWFIAAMALAGLSTGMMNYFLPAAAIRLFAILRTGGRYAERLTSHDTTFRLLAGMRLWLFRQLAPLAPAGLQDRRGADLADSLQADVDTLQHAYLRLGAPLIMAAICAMLVTAVLLILHPPSAVVVLALMLGAGALLPLRARRIASRQGAEAVRLRAALRVALTDNLQGSADLAAAGAALRHQAATAELSRALVAAQRGAAVPGALAETGVAFAAGLAMLLILLLAGTDTAAGSLAPALVPALMLAAFAAFEAVAPVPAAAHRLGEVTAAARRIFALADRAPQIPEHPDQPSPIPQDASLRFEAVRLRYAPDAPPALDGLDLYLHPGERVALMGPSGAGKSSIPRLLLRFWEYEGTIRLGGHDLRLYRPEELRRLIGVASQETQLLSGTLRDNLTLAAPEADEAAMRHALSVAQLDDFLSCLPDGLDSWIGEGGSQISAGQARRLVIARTLLRDPLILILDEPTENLDAQTAGRLLAAIIADAPHRTTLLITHDRQAAEQFASTPSA